ncbi:hypothetical protein QMK19_40145 [Streptomyces sp. H10-C2]|uniref:hypothetical protein n=1 Tax=unclassified Streptomyces TaxID=2593676 RepID=UPI0024BBE3E6|nr:MULTISPECIES: hypothetical protein [unclassified Streptomyces]MDJ0347385.1 hypothetical protein [Streptomyces sp. PH10-H1]MDJ0375629.1 hypothetical protein [Streptomyces sp. H10-C2]
MRRSEHLATTFHRQYERLAQTPEDDLLPEELLGEIREAAALLERFLKSLRLEKPSANLFALINSLASAALGPQSISALHALRRAANASKHEPGFLLRPREASKILGDAAMALGELSRLRHVLDEEYAITDRRTFAVLPSYYLHGGPPGGEAAYSIALLVPDGRLISVDSYQIDAICEGDALEILGGLGELDTDPLGGSLKDPRELGDLRAEPLGYSPEELGQHGELQIEPPANPLEALRRRLVMVPVGDSRITDSEYWGGWTYIGRLRDFVSAFAHLQHDLAVEGQRRRSTRSQKAAIAMALVDLGGLAAVESKLLSCVTDDFALDESPQLRGFVHEAAALAERSIRGSVGNFSGPRIIGTDAFPRASHGAFKSSSVSWLAIQAGGTVVLDVGEAWAPMP